MPEKQDRFVPEQREKILELIKHLDGHTIFSTEILAGFPADLQTRFTREHVSQTGSPMGTLFKDGQILPRLVGVYGLQVLQGICGDLNIPYMRCLGRGSEARSCREAIGQHFQA